MSLSIQRLWSTPSLPFSVLLLLAAALCAHAQPKTPPVRSTSVGKVLETPDVTRGGSVKIFIRGIALPRDTVEFKITKPPRHGALVESRRIDPATMCYIYRHSGAKTSATDEFRISLQTAPDNLWGPVPVKVFISEPPSRLDIDVASLDFGPVPIGQTSPRTLRIRNSGGGTLAGLLESAPPWSIEGDSAFTLNEGQAREFSILFSPAGPDSQGGRVVVKSSAGERAVTLQGEGTYRFSAPERSAFEQNADANRLELTLKNLVDQELTLAITAEPPLRCAESLVLPARDRAVLAVGLEKKEHHSQKFASLEIRDGPATRSVRVDLPPPPAELVWKEDQPASPREYEPGSRPLLEFQLENKGLTPAENVRVRAGEGGLVPGPYRDPILSIESGGNATISATWDLPPEPGEVEAVLIASHGGLEETLRVKARVVARELDLPPPARKRASPPSPMVENKTAPQPPPDLEISSVSASRHLFSLAPAVRLDFSWKIPEGTKNFSFQKLKGIRGGEKDWRKFDNVEWLSNPDSSSAAVVLYGLAPGQHRFRLCSVDPGGAANRPVEFIVSAPGPLFSFWMWFPALALLVALPVALRLRKLIGFHGGDDLDRRIAELEKK